MDALVRSGLPPAPEPSEGYLQRELASGADWEKAFRLAMTIGCEDGFDTATYAPLLQRRIGSRREQAKRSILRSWCVFRDGEHAAAMGIVTRRIEGIPIASQ